jgi:hypothetical protein
MAVNGIAIAVMGAGGLFIYGAITDRSIISMLQSSVTGKGPPGASKGAHPITQAPTLAQSGNTTFDPNAQSAVAGVGASAVASFLKSKRMSRAGTAGIMGNIEIESHFSPGSGSVDSNGLWSGGIVSWNGSRYQDMVNYAKAHGQSDKDMATQLNFLWFDLTTHYPILWAQLMVATNPQSAAQAFDSTFERSATGEAGLVPERLAAAQSWYERLG